MILVYCCLSIHMFKEILEPPFFVCSMTFCSLGSNQISDEGACAVAAALQVNQSLQHLKWVQPFKLFGFCILLFRYTYVHSWRFLEPPFFVCSLTFCSLGSNQIRYKGVCAVATALQVNLSLQQLEWVQPFKFIDSCTYTVAYVGIHTFMEILEPPFFVCSMTFCSLGSNQISDEGACAVAAALQVNQSLQHLKWV